MIIKLSASSAYRFTNCPYSVKAELYTPQELIFEGSKDAAILGTKIHECGEETIKAILKGVKPPTIASLIKKHDIQGVYDKEKAVNAVKGYASWFKKELKKHKNPKVLIEKKFRLFRDDFEYVFKADCIIMSKERLVIADLKSGNFDYTESATRQLSFSHAVLKKLKPKYKPTEIVGTIVQSNFWQDDKKIVELKFDLVDDYMEYLENHIKSENIKAGSHCAFCKAKLVCPYMRNMSEIVNTMSMHTDIAQISTDTLQELFLNKEHIEKFLKNISGVLLDRMSKNGETLDKVMLEPMQTKRAWTDKKEVAKKLKHLGNKIYDEPKLKSPAQLEKIAGKKNIEGLYYKPQVKKVGPRVSEFDNE